jgi:L-cysteine S-thiosulfotransferase
MPHIHNCTSHFRHVGIALGLVVACMGTAQTQEPPRTEDFRVVGDAIPEPLGGLKGDAGRGKALALARDAACILCHAFPGAPEGTMGNIAPPLDGVGARRSAAELRLRLVDSLRINPQSPMPAYYRVDGLERVASAYRNKPIMSAQEIEDVIAYLLTLR